MLRDLFLGLYTDFERAIGDRAEYHKIYDLLHTFLKSNPEDVMESFADAARQSGASIQAERFFSSLNLMKMSEQFFKRNDLSHIEFFAHGQDALVLKARKNGGRFMALRFVDNPNPRPDSVHVLPLEEVCFPPVRGLKIEVTPFGDKTMPGTDQPVMENWKWTLGLVHVLTLLHHENKFEWRDAHIGNVVEYCGRAMICDADNLVERKNPRPGNAEEVHKHMSILLGKIQTHLGLETKEAGLQALLGESDTKGVFTARDFALFIEEEPSHNEWWIRRIEQLGLHALVLPKIIDGKDIVLVADPAGRKGPVIAKKLGGILLGRQDRLREPLKPAFQS